MMEIGRHDRGSPDGGHSASAFSISISQDSALPTTATLHTTEPDDDDDDDDRTEAIVSHTPSRSKSNDTRRMKKVESSPQPSPATGSSSADRFKHGIRYITDGFIRKVTKQNTISRIHTLTLNNLRDKKIRYIENLQSLTNLEILDLSNNLIERIDGLKTLKKLKQLLLANNFIRTISNLEELSRLEILDLHENQISEIPVWFGKRLNALRCLNLGQNQISSFDQIARLRTLYELRQIHLQGNPIDRHEHYRLLVISYIPSLEQLDGIDVTEDERRQAKEQFIQQEVQNLLHELERRDHECRRLNNQATTNVQKLEVTSDKLQTLENKSSIQAKEIEELQERLATSEALLQRKTTLLHQACEKQCQLEQELAFYKIDLKFDRFNLSKNANRTTAKGSSLLNPSILKLSPQQFDDEDGSRTPSKRLRSIPWSSKDIQRILGDAPNDKFHQSEDESIYNEKLLQLAVNVSELTFLQAKQRIVEDRLQKATDEHQNHAVIEHLSDDLNQLQTEMMDKISDVQELKLVLHGLRRDNGEYLANDLEQVTIELKLDEIVREHIIQMKQTTPNESTSSTATVGTPSSTDEILRLQATLTHQLEQLRNKELNEQVSQHQILDLQLALERQQTETRDRIQQIEEMAEREKQRILKHLEDEKRFTRDIIEKSETMIEQLKRELSIERERKSDEQKAQESLRDIYKKIHPNFIVEQKSKRSNDENDDDDDQSQSDGETTVYQKDDPLLASTPRDRSLLIHRNENSDLTFLQHQLDEHDDEHISPKVRRESRRTSLPPTPKRKTTNETNSRTLSNGASLSMEKTPTNKRSFITLTSAINDGQEEREEEEEDADLLYRLHGFVKKGQLFMSNLGDLGRTATTVNDSGYSSQQTGREGNHLDNPKLQPLLASQPFSTLDKTLIDPMVFNRDYTVGVVTTNGAHYRHNEQSDVKNVTLYPTPEGYVLGPYSVNVPPPNQSTAYANISPCHSIAHTESQYFACVTIPPDGLSSNRPLPSSRDNANEVRLQGPVVFRQDSVLPPEHVSPVSVKIRSLQFPQVERGTMTDTEGIPRSIDRIQDEIDFLKAKLHQQTHEHQTDNQYHMYKDLLEEQTRELHRVRTQYQDLNNAGRETEATRHDLFNQLQRIRRNVHEHLSPNLLRFVEKPDAPVVPPNPNKLIPLNHDEHWICTVPRHTELEQVISDLQNQLDEYRQQLTAAKQENRRLERSLVKKSIKIDALDLAASNKRAKNAAEAENIQDDLYVLEQQLIRKQRELTVAQDQLKQMTSLSHQVIGDLKTARQRHMLVKRETKAFELKINSLTRKLYKVTSETKDAEELYAKISTDVQTLDHERVKLDKIVDEKRALNIVLDEQLRASLQSFNSLLNSSIKCLQDLTTATNPTDEEFRFHSLPPSPPQLSQLSSTLPAEEIQRQVSHIVSENNRLLARYHHVLQQQRQKSNALQNEIVERENELTKIRTNLDIYNDQLKKNAEELLQDKTVLEELERIKEMKSDKLAEIERLIDRRQAQEKHAQQELEQLNNEQNRLKKHYKDALAEHEQLKHNIDADRQILNEMKNESLRLREQIKSFLDDKETLDETCDLLAKKCEALHNECKEKENNLPTLIGQIDEKLTVCKNLEDDIRKLKSDKTRCLEEVTEMKEKIERKRIELAQSPTSFELEQQNDELKHRIRRNELDLDRLNRDIDERNRTLNELNTMIAYAKSIMKNVQPNENRQNYAAAPPPLPPPPSNFHLIDQRHQQENNIYYETKIQRLTKTLDEKEQELRAVNLQLITTKDELQQMQYKVQNQESNADAIRNSMQIELDKLRHWLQIYENRKAMLRPQYQETLKELELKLHEQEMFYRKQIQELDSEMKKKYHSKPSDDSGFLSDTTVVDHRFSPSIDPHDTSMLREQIQHIFSHHVQELDKCNSKYKTNLSNLKNRLHELENSTSTTSFNPRLDA